MVLDTPADLQAAQGDLKRAIATQRRAVQHAGPAADEISRYLEELAAQERR